MFTTENTAGYTNQQLTILNAELAEKLNGLEIGTEEYYNTEKAFYDEVAGR